MTRPRPIRDMEAIRMQLRAWLELLAMLAIGVFLAWV